MLLMYEENSYFFYELSDISTFLNRSFIILLEVPTKANPQRILQIQPSKKKGVRTSWHSPIRQFIVQELHRSAGLHLSRLVQQNTANPARIVPAKYNVDTFSGTVDIVLNVR